MGQTPWMLDGRRARASSKLIARARGRVRQLEAAGLSRRAIAAKADGAPSTVTRLMNDRQPHVSKPAAVKLAEVRLGRTA